VVCGRLDRTLLPTTIGLEVQLRQDGHTVGNDELTFLKYSLMANQRLAPEGKDSFEHCRKIHCGRWGL